MMVDDLTEGDAELVRIVTGLAQRVVGGERAYDVCRDLGELADLIGKARNDGAAYGLWAEMGDLLSAPGGPGSESACNKMIAAAATDWLIVETDSPEAVAAYFERWNPVTGSSWLAQEASWGSPDASGDIPGR